MEHYHIYRPLEFPLDSGLVESYSRVSIYFEARPGAQKCSPLREGVRRRNRPGDGENMYLNLL